MYLINYKERAIRTDNAVYIKHLNDTAYVVTDELNAEGVCYNGEAMWYADGAMVSQFDAGHDMDVAEEKAKENEAMVETAMCEQEEMEATRFENIELALCELDEAGKVE